jgi:ABC-type sugar transport system permease subunit
MFEWRRAAALAGFAALAGVGALTFSRRVTRELRQATRRVFAARAAYLLLLPTFLLLAVFTYYPMGTALGYSFWKFSLTSPMEFVGLDNFREMAHDPYLRRAVVNMIILLATGIVKMIVLPLLAAELVFWIASPRLQQFFRAAVTFPAVIPGVVMVLVWKMIYDPYSGLVNMTLRALGLANLQHAWLGDEHYALWAVVFFHFPWINLLIFLIFLGGLLQVDRNIFEAADIDGASVTQRFLHIDIPALRPKLQLALTLIFLWSVQDYASVLIFTGGGPGVSTYVPALHMFLQISGGQNFGYSSAIGLVLFLLVLAFTFTSRRFNREELP